MAGTEPSFVSRGGIKLAAALDAFGINPTGWCCADLGSHVGGFVDCLLQRGAARVYSVDTSYGTLAWKLRKDPRVMVMERINALHVELPESVDFVTIDVGWTPQHLIVPQAMKLLAPHGRIITLIKPHYEAPKALLREGVLPDNHFDTVVGEVNHRLRESGITVLSMIESPIRGHAGNRELLALIKRQPTMPVH